MWAMERTANDKVSGDCPSIEEVYSFCRIEAPNTMQMQSLLPQIYTHWKERRFTEHNGEMITPHLKVKHNSQFYLPERRKEI